MSAPRIGELFAGYGGLGMGVQAVFGGEMAWYSEIDKGALKILGHRFPDVPNIGDITAVDWSQVEPVDILTGGSPCQDLSHAGKRAGMTEGTRSNLWVAMREAIAQLKPSLVVWENVGGAFSAAADSEVEPCAGCVGDGSGVNLRALGRVLGDLASLGFDAEWVALRAADVGAPHGRLRVFVVAYPSDRAGHRQWARAEPWRGGQALPDPERGRRDGRARVAGRLEVVGTSAQGRGQGTLLPTPVADNSRCLPSPGTDFQSLPNAVCALLPTPAVNDMGASYTPEEWDAWTNRMKAEHGNGNGHGKSLHIEAARLLPTPNASDNPDARRSTKDGSTYSADGYAREVLGDIAATDRWGQYTAAIHRWETLTRPAPAPTETGPKGNPRLSAAFSEWMMGLPAGWVTDVPGITRNEALKALGNGVVPQQAEAAIRTMLAWEVAA